MFMNTVLPLIVPTIVAQPVQWPDDDGGNGHYYDAVSIPSGIAWRQAEIDARLLQFAGRRGHLATITSSSEALFLSQTFRSSVNLKWLGGFQRDPFSATDLGWEWVTGEPWSFTSWAAGEPNDIGGLGSESVLQIKDTTSPYIGWNDASSGSLEAGYIIEYPDPPLPPNDLFPVQWPETSGGNGHYYSVIVVPGSITWEEARSLAEARSFAGRRGHLATFISPVEEFFVRAEFGEALANRWLGGYQPDPTSAPDSGWAWVTGEPWGYTNWTIGEPNDGFGPASEDALVMQSSLTWNDRSRAKFRTGFVIEFSQIDGCIADLAFPLGTLDLSDFDAFITAFLNGGTAADLAEPFGVLDLLDADVFIAAFLAGCP